MHLSSSCDRRTIDSVMMIMRMMTIKTRFRDNCLDRIHFHRLTTGRQYRCNSARNPGVAYIKGYEFCEAVRQTAIKIVKIANKIVPMFVVPVDEVIVTTCGAVL